MPRDAIDRILDPETVAVVGASTDQTKRGNQVLHSLDEGGYDGTVYAVNPNHDEIMGHPAYPTVAAIGRPIDLALIATPAPVVPTVLDGCADVDVAGAVVLAVGFGESGDEGERLEDEIVRTATRHGIRLVGPNTSGLINVHRGLNLVGMDTVPEGNLALVCQSGNLAIELFTGAVGRSEVGFSHYVGVGNQADLRFDEYLPFFAADEHTDAILAYIEGVPDGRAFLETASGITDDVPIVALKGGRSEIGRESARSHTGAMAGDSRVAEGVFRQAGIVTVDRSDELLAVGHALANQPVATGPNVAVLADGGGHATLASDGLDARGLSLAELSADTRSTLRTVLPAAANVSNPVDVAGGTDDDQGVFATCAEALLEDEHVDVLLLTGLFGGYGIRFAEEYTAVETQVAERIAEMATETGVPLVVQSAYEGFDSPAHDVLRGAGVPVLRSLDVAIAVVEKLVRARRVGSVSPMVESARATNESRTLTTVLADGNTKLTEPEARAMLVEYGIPAVPAELVTSEAAAVEAWSAVEGPISMKVVSRDIGHKSDVGGIALDIDSPEAVRTAYHDLLKTVAANRPEAKIDGVLVSPMRAGGTEFVVGVVNTPQFGKVIMFGPGGVFVELLDDVGFRALPLDTASARDLIDGIAAQDLFDGARGRAPVNREALVEFLIDVSDMVVKNPALTELDLNPVFARGEVVEALDATFRLEESYRSRDADGPLEVKRP